MRAVWGFDLGVASVGFAVLRLADTVDAGQPCDIARLGVRIFPESRDRDHIPFNVGRREARLARRQMRRRRGRRLRLRALLADAGLLPDGDARPPAGQDPYELRARGLHEGLPKHEIGWALFHLLKRRGFQGSRKRADAVTARVADEDAESHTKAQVLADKLADRRLGEYLASVMSTVDTPVRRRGVGQTRAMVCDELDALWTAQRAHHPELTDSLRARLDAIALHQRPTFFRTRTFGQCELEPGQPRALKAEWLTQRFETLQLVNALRLEGGNQRGLDETERAKAIDCLESTPRPTWAALRKALGFGRSERFTHERGKKETIRGNAAEAMLRCALGADFPAHPSADLIRHEIGAAWHRVEYRPERDGTILAIRDAAESEGERARLALRAEAEWGISPNQAKALAAINLPDGTGRHSLAAIRRLMPRLEAGEAYSTAVRAVYGEREIGTPVSALPGPNLSELCQARRGGQGCISDPFVLQRMQALLASIRNPTVLRTLGELQKVVNTLLRVYGRPDLIRLEMARDLKLSAQERREIDANQRRRERAREDARKSLSELGRADASKEDVLRFLLWREQGGRSPYSGDPISCADMLSADATQIDHIFPASRSLDDSQSNKVLCFARENRDKGSCTPFEWLNGQVDVWSHLSGTVWPQMAKAGWPDAKRRRCQKSGFETADSSEFTARQLVDTSFIARAARDYLGLLFGGGQAGLNGVQVVPGRATAYLRDKWGIGIGGLLHGKDGQGPKARDDHRHHAVDALVVALTDPHAVQQLSRWWQVRESTRQTPKFPSPWPSFRAQAKVAVEAIVVSHRVQAKLSGPLHEETRLGDTGEAAAGSMVFVKRKPVTALTIGDVDHIRDPAVQRAVRAAIDAAGGKLTTAVARPIRLPRRDGSPGPLISRVRLTLKRAKTAVMRVHPTKNIYAELGPGSNDHIAIYLDGQKVRPLTATRQESLRRALNGESTVPSLHPAGGKLVMALRPNDVLQRVVDGRCEYRLVRKFNAAGQIFFKPLEMSGTPKPEESLAPSRWIREGWRKVSVDPIGRIRPAR